MKSQTEYILNHLKAGKTITPIQALNLYGCFRLGARIWDLKCLGYPIDCEIISGENKKHFASYFLKHESKQLTLF